MKSKSQPSRFSPAELITLLSIIGLLAVVTLPSYISYRTHNRASTLANSFRLYASAFKSYAEETRSWPADQQEGRVPPGMENRLPRFTEGSILGGKWDWNPHAGDLRAAVCLIDPIPKESVIEHMDVILDDGDLSTGAMVFNGKRILFFLKK